jgi:hypothetical protein
MLVFEFPMEYINSNAQKLSIILEKALMSPTLSYIQVCEKRSQGLYIIFNEKEILYVGKTNRTGKLRMRELAADFRSHTFNKKLLSKHFKDLGFVFKILKNVTKKEWSDNGTMTKADFKVHQNAINQYIRTKMKFKFYEEQDLM